MSNDFIRVSEIELIPIFEQMGAKLIKKIPNEIAFSIKEFEVYGVVSSSNLKQSVYFSELLSEYLNEDDIALYHLSERFSIETCMRKLADITTSKIFPLIEDGRIIDAMNLVMLNRREGICKYNESLVEKEAEKAFKEKRYIDVVSQYSMISELNDVQAKRLKISIKKIGK